jgi:hypothetical protein
MADFCLDLGLERSELIGTPIHRLGDAVRPGRTTGASRLGWGLSCGLVSEVDRAEHSVDSVSETVRRHASDIG